MSDKQRQVTLPDSMLAAIAAVTNSSMSGPAKVEAVVLMVHGYGLWNREVAGEDGKFDPTSYAIPKYQWLAIAEFLTGSSESIEGVNYGLDWMNYGPSAFEEESA